MGSTTVQTPSHQAEPHATSQAASTHAGAGSNNPPDDELQATAASLLLRSPRLSVSLILELLDIGDAQFRQLSRSNPTIADLLEQRRCGALSAAEPELKTCPGCEEWFIPYAGQRCCSDECNRISRIVTTT